MYMKTKAGEDVKPVVILVIMDIMYMSPQLFQLDKLVVILVIMDIMYMAMSYKGLFFR